jgi:hypothetical protein
MVHSRHRAERVTDTGDESPNDRLKRDIEEIAEARLRKYPSIRSCRLMPVYRFIRRKEALSLHRVRYETEVLADRDESE